MSLIKEALDKAVEEDPDDTPVEESYRKIEDSAAESNDSTPEEPETVPSESDDDSIVGTILIISIVVILSLVAIGQVVFLLTYFT